MRLDFNVLWLDDQPDHVSAQITRIKTRMEAEGFYFNPTLCKSIEQVRESLGDDVFNDEVDLILVDWDLGGELQGQNAIAEIRESVQYKDIVFYSARYAAAEIRRLAFEEDLEGIYCATREELVEEVLGVFTSLVKKVLDLDHTRGIVMGATSDIDYMVNQCLAAMHAQCDQVGREALLSKARSCIENKAAEYEKMRTRVNEASTIMDLFGEYMIFTAYDRLRTLASALKYENFKVHRGYRRAVVDYQREAVPGRNILGSSGARP